MRECMGHSLFTMQGVTLLIRFETKDFDHWRAVFGEWDPMPGATRVAVYRDLDVPTQIVASIDWKDADKARAYVDDQQLKARMLEAGVVGVPEFHLVSRVADSASG